MSAATVQIEESWRGILAEEFEKPYFQSIKTFLQREKQAGRVIYPPGPMIFHAFDMTPFGKVKAVILGQDPYHQPRQAMGLSFSVPREVDIPPSLRKIYQELQADQPPFRMPTHGDLTKWAQQGVLLLNATLTVEAGKPNSHQSIGWSNFTDAVIRSLSEQREGLVFMLWGKFAQSKKPLIDELKHFVLEAAHPSPLAGDAFLGCKHFSKCNQLLAERGETPINWQL